MQIVTFRYQRFNSASNEAKQRHETEQPVYPFGQLKTNSNIKTKAENKKNVEQIQRIGSSNDIILGSWQ